MKRKIKTLFLKDGKQIFYPTDDECKALWDQVERIDIEESYTMAEWREKFVLIRSFEDKPKPDVIKDKYWICNYCGRRHAEDFVCVMQDAT